MSEDRKQIKRHIKKLCHHDDNGVLVTLAVIGPGYFRLHVDAIKLEWWYEKYGVLKATWQGGFLRFYLIHVLAVTHSESGWTITVNASHH